MELPSRSSGDQLLPSGECRDIRRRLQQHAAQHDLRSVVINAFDRRTRILPFNYSCTHMVPAGARIIGASMADSGFEKTRLVLQQWNRNIRPSRLILDGQPPDVLMVSSMQIHAAACEGLIREACTVDPDRRPLIIAGGPRAIYQPWSVFSNTPEENWGADVAVTGEAYVLLNLMEVLLAERGDGESMRSVFHRARRAKMLDDVPGLVYANRDEQDRPVELVDTGIQRMVGDLDELPHATIGFNLLEPSSRRATLSERALEPRRLRWYGPVASMIFTSGCKFRCPYCPIPAYNQRQHRAKSPERLADEMAGLYQQFGIRHFFGTDDNFFNDHERALEICRQLSTIEVHGRPLRHNVRWGTEVTVHDTLAMKEHLRVVRKAGAMAFWLGVEDITATFVKKGQSVDKTTDCFRSLQEVGIMPIAMLMHHDGQPFISRGSEYGLLNQIRLLRKAGALDVQVLCMTPAPGSKLYEGAFASGQVIASAGGKTVEPYMHDANYVIASQDPQPWRMQLKVAGALAYFYNPLRLLGALIKPNSSRYLIDGIIQVVGMYGLVQTLPRMLGWAARLAMGPIRLLKRAPHPTLPMRDPAGQEPCHGLENMEPEETGEPLAVGETA